MPAFTRKALLLLLLLHQARNRKLLKQIDKQKKKLRVRNILTDRKKHFLIANLKLHDHEHLKSFRMSPTSYEELLGLVALLE